MPRDDWAKASRKERAKHGVKVGLSKHLTGRNGRKADRSKARQKSHTKAEILRKRLQSPTTKLWFGKFAGRQIQDIPADYLHWLATTFAEGRQFDQRMQLLVDGIRRYLSHPQSSGRRPQPQTKATKDRNVSSDRGREFTVQTTPAQYDPKKLPGLSDVPPEPEMATGDGGCCMPVGAQQSESSEAGIPVFT